jgi:hypothetical protein
MSTADPVCQVGLPGANGEKTTLDQFPAGYSGPVRKKRPFVKRSLDSDANCSKYQSKPQ